MKSLLPFALLLVCLSIANAQEKKPYNEKQNIKVDTNQEPFYPKGDAVLYEFVNSSITYSDDLKSKNFTGTVSLSFDVKADSSIVNALIIQGVDPAIDEQLKKMVEKLRFAPAIQNGFKMKMNVMMNFPVQAH